MHMQGFISQGARKLELTNSSTQHKAGTLGFPLAAFQLAGPNIAKFSSFVAVLPCKGVALFDFGPVPIKLAQPKPMHSFRI